MKTILIIAVIILLFVIPVIVAINNHENREIVDVIDIKGKITNISREGNRVVILVERDIDQIGKYDIASIKVDENTIVIKNKTKEKVNLNELMVGNIVEVTFTGAVAESYPIQAVAQTVNLISWGE